MRAVAAWNVWLWPSWPDMAGGHFAIHWAALDTLFFMLFHNPKNFLAATPDSPLSLMAIDVISPCCSASTPYSFCIS
jgi:hypothetical protein